MVNPGNAGGASTGPGPYGKQAPYCLSLHLPLHPSPKPSLAGCLHSFPWTPCRPFFKRPFQIQFPPRQPGAPVADINQNLLLQLWSECVNTAFRALIIIQQMLFTDTVITYISLYLCISSSQNSCLPTSLNRMPELEGNLEVI